MSDKILIVGDLHGDWGYLNNLLNKRNPDVVLCCGDFGWWPRMDQKDLRAPNEPWDLRGIKSKGAQVYWCDGNHEDHTDLKEQQYLGEICEMYPDIYYCPRGSLLTLEDSRTVLFYGGADSIDKDYRTEGFDWFREEIPNSREFRRAGEHKHVDIIVSHTCPLEFQMVGHVAGKEDDPTRQDLSMLLAKYQPSQWFFGHWHNNKVGQYGKTKWEALSYPGSGSKWWRWL